MACKNERWGFVAAFALLLGCFESSVDPETSGNDTDSSGTACIPGETQACLCVGGGDGVQACNEQGTGYGECACVGETSASGTSGATSTNTTTPTATSTSTNGMDTGDTGDSGDTTETGVMDTGPKLDLPSMDGDYGPCGAAGDCPPGQLCVGDPAGGGQVCTVPCSNDGDCPPPPPGFPGDESPACQPVATGELACMLPCTDDTSCPQGMFCIIDVCVW